MEPFFKFEIAINATKEQVWDVLTNPEKTSQYMFGCRAVSDWKPGSTLNWVGVADGKEVTYVTGEVVVFDPFNTFEYTVIDPTAAYPKTRENHLVITCTLRTEGDVTVLSVLQGDYSKVADGAARYAHSNGWDQMGGAMKALAEAAGR
jgi:uncharacterized protein YndB with AHSA1/START domain